MKSKPAIFAGCVVLSLAVFLQVRAMVQVRSEMARKVQADDTAHKLAAEINIFRLNMDRLPASLSELESNFYQTNFFQNIDERKTLQNILGIVHSNEWNDKYEFKATTNGFEIVVLGTNPASANPTKIIAEFKFPAEATNQ